jgi:hypothetical protein
MLIGTVSDYMALQFAGNQPSVLPWITSAADVDDAQHAPGSDDDDGNDAGPIPGPRTDTMIWLAAKHRKS